MSHTRQAGLSPRSLHIYGVMLCLVLVHRATGSESSATNSSLAAPTVPTSINITVWTQSDLETVSNPPDNVDMIQTILNLWRSSLTFKVFVCCVSATLVLLVVGVVVSVCIRAKRAARAQRMERVDPLHVRHASPDVLPEEPELTRYCTSPEKPDAMPLCEDYMIPCPSNKRESVDKRYINFKDVEVARNGHARAAPRHSCPLKRRTNKGSLYDDVMIPEGSPCAACDDDTYVLPQERGEQTDTFIDEPTHLDYSDVSSDQGSMRCKADNGNDQNTYIKCYNNFTYDLKPRSASEPENPSHGKNAVDAATVQDDDIYVNTAVGMSDTHNTQPDKVPHKGSVTSLPRAPIGKPIQRRESSESRKPTRGRHDRCESEECQREPLNSDSIYDDVIDENEATDDMVYVNVEHTPSDDCIYDDTLWPATAPPGDGTNVALDRQDSSEYYIDMTCGSPQCPSQRSSLYEPTYLTVLE